MQLPSRLAALASVAALFLSANCVDASVFDGQDIRATAYFPDLPPGSTTVGGPVTKTVGPGIEFSDGEFGAFFGPSFDFADSTITITHAQTGHVAGTFNGYEFFDVNDGIPDFVDVVILSDSTGFFSGDPSRVFFDANNVYVNFESLSFGSQNDPTIVLGVRAVPEPTAIAIWSILGLTIAGVAFRRKRK